MKVKKTLNGRIKLVLSERELSYIAWDIDKIKDLSDYTKELKSKIEKEILPP